MTIVNFVHRLFNSLKSKNEDLAYITSIKKFDGYGTVTDYYKIRNISNWILTNLGKYETNRLFVTSSINGKWIPMVDCDNEQDLLRSTLWLSEQNIGYVILSSSMGKYWVFVDILCPKIKHALEIIKTIPGNDEEFVAYCVSTEIISVRADFKVSSSIYKPTIRDINTNNQELIKFANKLQEHFEDRRLIWIYRYYRYSRNEIHISDPQTGESIGITLKDIKETAD